MHLMAFKQFGLTCNKDKSEPYLVTHKQFSVPTVDCPLIVGSHKFASVLLVSLFHTRKLSLPHLENWAGAGHPQAHRALQQVLQLLSFYKICRRRLEFDHSIEILSRKNTV